MIINGDAAGNTGFWSKHLVRVDTNERAEVMEISGLLSEDLPTALREMKAIADQSRSGGNFMYQANINPRDDEHLTSEQWKQAIDTLEKNLGFDGHQRVVVEHEKEGRTHRHVIWNRVDVETLRVADIGGNFYTHERTARELEERFSLSRTTSLHGQLREEGRPDRPAELWEHRAAERSGVTPAQLKAELTELWRSTDSGRSFAAALDERGYALAQGDRRNFCVVDHAGDAHSLARRLEGVKAKDVRERMADIDRDSLPTVAEARDSQRAKLETGQVRDRDAAVRFPEVRGNDAIIAPDTTAKVATVEPSPIPKKVDRVDHLVPQKSRNEVAAEARMDAWLEKAEASRSRVDKPAQTPTISDGLKPALAVLDVSTGVATKLVDFVVSLLTGGSPPPVASSNAERIQEQQQAVAALERISENIERGQNLRPEDVRDLTPTHLENIKAKGDDYMRSIIEGMQRERERDNDWGRERER